ncbi:MAG: FRG domain-containing protein [Thermodesulfobacteriota bacterium]
MADGPLSNSMDLWRAYRSIKMDTFGPLRVFGGIPESSVEFMAEPLTRFLRDLRSDMRPGALDPGRRYAVPDAASAALLLHLDNEASAVLGSPTVYRGQADHPEWTIQASIDRTRASDQEQQHLTLLFGAMTFVFMLHSIDWQVGGWHDKGWHLDDHAAYAMARHHGMSSPLIDFTVDPSVAVNFAQEQALRAGTEMAAVFRFTLDDLEGDTLLTVPPPPFLRSPRQHGVYFHSVLEGDGSPRQPRIEKAVTICFPAESPPIYHDGLLRDGNLVDLMHADPLLAAIEEYIRRFMAHMPVAAIHQEYMESPESVPRSLQQIGLFQLIKLEKDGMLTRDGQRFRYCQELSAIVEWFSLTTDIVHSLFGITWAEGRVGFRPDLVDHFVRHNYIQMQVYLLFFTRFLRHTPCQGLLPCMRILNTKLLEISKGCVGICSPELILEGTSIMPGEVRSTPWLDPNGSTRSD